MIKYFVPKSLKEATEILSQNDCYILAGGTDLMVQKHRSASLLPTFEKDVLFTNEIKELDYIKVDKVGVHVGSVTKYEKMLKSTQIPDIFRKTIEQIASPGIRNMATMAGNIGNASPAGDTLVPLNVFDAYLVLSSIRGERKVLVSDYIIGVRKTIREKDEIIKEIVIPNLDLEFDYEKVGSRKAESISKVSFLGAYKLEGNIIKDFRVAFGSVSIKVVRDKEAEKKYIGLTKEEFINRKEEIVSDYSKLISPITDHRSTKEYRQKVACNLLSRFINNIK